MERTKEFHPNLNEGIKKFLKQSEISDSIKSSDSVSDKYLFLNTYTVKIINFVIHLYLAIIDNKSAIKSSNKRFYTY